MRYEKKPMAVPRFTVHGVPYATRLNQEHIRNPSKMLSDSSVFLEVIHDKIPYLWIISQTVDDIFCYFDYLDIK